MLVHGLLASINTDDPGVSAIDLAHEFEIAAPAAGLSREQIRQAQIKRSGNCVPLVGGKSGTSGQSLKNGLSLKLAELKGSQLAVEAGHDRDHEDENGHAKGDREDEAS